MNLNSLFRSNKAEINNSSTSISTKLKELNEYFNNSQILTNNSIALNSSTYYSCMQIRCNAVAKMPIQLLKNDEKGKVKAKEHELYYLLKKRPNPYTTPHDFIWATEFQRLEYGNAFWFIHMEQGKRKGIYLLDSTKVTIYIDENGMTGKSNTVFYTYNDPRKGMLIYTSDEIVHFKNFTMNGLEGTSVKKYLFDMITNEANSIQVIKEKFSSGLQNPILVQYAGDLNDAMQEKIKSKFKSMGGVKKAGSVVPIPSEFKIEQLETNFVNNQFFQLIELNSAQISNAFGVKSFQLNSTKSNSMSHDEQNKVFYTETLSNVLTLYEQEITYKALTHNEQVKEGYIVKFNADAMLKGDIEGRTRAYVESINNGIMSIAEVREKEDLPYVEGTDILIIGNGASIPLKELGNQYLDKENKKGVD